MAAAVLLGVLSSGLLRGVLIGAIISLVLLIQCASRPHLAYPGRSRATRRFSDRERHPDNELNPQGAIFCPEASLLYFNVEHVCDTIQDCIRSGTTPPKRVVLDLSASAHVDIQSAHILAGLADELASNKPANSSLACRVRRGPKCVNSAGHRCPHRDARHSEVAARDIGGTI